MYDTKYGMNDILSVTMGADSFFCTVWNQNSHLISVNTLSVWDDFVQLNNGSPKTVLSLQKTPFTLVARADFDSDSLELYLKNVASLDNTWKYDFDIIEALDMVVVYCVPENISYQLKKETNTQITHSATAMIGQNLKRHSSAVCLDVDKESISITAISEGRLLIYNQYLAKTGNEILYFVGLVYQQLLLNRSEVPLILSGHITADSKLYQLLYKYFKELRFQIPLLRKEAGHQFPNHLFYQNYALSKCV